MYTLLLQTDDEDLKNLLVYSSTMTTTNHFSFSSIEKAVEVLQAYTFLKIKKELIYKITKEDISSDFIQSFLLIVPEKRQVEFKDEIGERLYNFLLELSQQNECFFFDGFVTFRLKDIKQRFESYLSKEFDYYLHEIHYDTKVDEFIQFMRNHPNQQACVTIRTFQNQHIVVLNQQEEVHFLETEGEQEDVVLQTIFLAPQKVIVEDKFNIIEKDIINALKQLFFENLHFI